MSRLIFCFAYQNKRFVSWAVTWPIVLRRFSGHIKSETDLFWRDTWLSERYNTRDGQGIQGPRAGAGVGSSQVPLLHGKPGKQAQDEERTWNLAGNVQLTQENKRLKGGLEQTQQQRTSKHELNLPLLVTFVFQKISLEKVSTALRVNTSVSCTPTAHVSVIHTLPSPFLRLHAAHTTQRQD